VLRVGARPWGGALKALPGRSARPPSAARPCRPGAGPEQERGAPRPSGEHVRGKRRGARLQWRACAPGARRGVGAAVSGPGVDGAPRPRRVAVRVLQASSSRGPRGTPRGFARPRPLPHRAAPWRQSGRAGLARDPSHGARGPWPGGGAASRGRTTARHVRASSVAVRCFGAASTGPPRGPPQRRREANTKPLRGSREAPARLPRGLREASARPPHTDCSAAGRSASWACAGVSRACGGLFSGLRRAWRRGGAGAADTGGARAELLRSAHDDGLQSRSGA
jgi:hypothetical protein